MRRASGRARNVGFCGWIFRCAIGGALLAVATESVAAAPSSLSAALETGDAAAFAELLDRILYEDLVAALAEDDPVPFRPPWSLERLQQALPPQTVLLAFHPDGEITWGVAIARDLILPRRLDAPHTPVMAVRLRAWQEDPAAHPWDATAALLVHNNLFPPFREALARRRHVIVAASGALRGLPFEALVMTQAPDAPAHEQAFLTHRFEFTYEPTIASWLGWSSRKADLRRYRLVDGEVSGLRENPLPTGTVVAVAGEPNGGTALSALRWQRDGSRGALLGGTEESLTVFLREYRTQRAGGRRPPSRAARNVRLRLLQAGARPEEWALPLLWGAD